MSSAALRKGKSPKGLLRRARHALRNLLYPGLDLHTRNRASLCAFWDHGLRDVLDAGSGNGYFSWLAYRSGARVVAINFDRKQTEKAREFLIAYKGCDPRRLSFETATLYDLDKETRQFDEIVCYETIEHIRDDARVIRRFFRLLRPGGKLHLCAATRVTNARHSTRPKAVATSARATPLGRTAPCSNRLALRSTKSSG